MSLLWEINTEWPTFAVRAFPQRPCFTALVMEFSLSVTVSKVFLCATDPHAHPELTQDGRESH